MHMPRTYDVENGIVELDLTEVFEVDGGVAPLLVAATYAGGSFVLGVAAGFGLIQIAKRM